MSIAKVMGSEITCGPVFRESYTAENPRNQLQQAPMKPNFLAGEVLQFAISDATCDTMALSTPPFEDASPAPPPRSWRARLAGLRSEVPEAFDRAAVNVLCDRTGARGLAAAGAATSAVSTRPNFMLVGIYYTGVKLHFRIVSTGNRYHHGEKKRELIFNMLIDTSKVNVVKCDI